MSTIVRFKLPRSLKDRAKGKKLFIPKPKSIEDDATYDYDELANDLVEPIEAALDARGIPRPQSVDWEPELVDDVTDLGSRELGMLHARFVAVCQWLDTEVARAEIDAARAEAYMKHVAAEVRLSKSGTVADKDAKTLNDSRFSEAELTSLKADAKAKLLRARLKGYERYASALSREMSRREMEARA